MAKPIKFQNHKNKTRWQAAAENGLKLVRTSYYKEWRRSAGTPVLFRSYYWAWLRGWLRDIKENREVGTFNEVK